MGSRMFLLLVLGLLLLTDHSQGAPEAHDQSVMVNTFTDASDVGKPLTTANPMNTPKRQNRECNCKGKRREMVNPGCACKRSARRKGQQRKLEKFCQKRKDKNLQICVLISKMNTKPLNKSAVPI